MRTLIMVFMIAGLMSTAGVYAASLTTPTIGAVAGSGSQTVSAGVSGTPDIAWTVSSGQVTGATISYTPTKETTYNFLLEVDGTTGTATDVVAAAQVGVTQTDIAITLGSAVNVETLTSAELSIFE